MFFSSITPESAGLSSANVEHFLRDLNDHGLATHSVLLMRGDKVFAEYYWKPFDKNFCHRMYSETKSFVAVAIGLLADEGKLSLTDTVASQISSRIDRELPSWLSQMTVEDMLRMETCGDTPNWFHEEDTDRTHIYFEKNSAHLPSGMRWKYDSNGSQVLATLVETLSGMSLFDYLNRKIFRHLGTFQTAKILKTKNEDSWGDSALVCTTRDMASFGRFVMNYGNWNGKQLLSEDFLRKATSPLTDNDELGFAYPESSGYGYQIWCLGEEGFFFNGMGCQLTICLPKEDLMLVITSDNQGFDNFARPMIFSLFRRHIVDEMLPFDRQENPEAYASLRAFAETLELCHIPGELDSPLREKIDGVTYVCEDNPMGIREFTLSFGEGEGIFAYTNAQGEKKLPFGMGKNVYGLFPELHYSRLHGGLKEEGHQYRCAASAAFREEGKLVLKVQITDDYLGNLFILFSFKEDQALVLMRKHAEAFLEEYEGMLLARRSE